MNKAFKHIRHKVCRTIYYFDWCPLDNRKSYRKIADNAFSGVMLVTAFILLMAFCLLCGN